MLEDHNFRMAKKYNCEDEYRDHIIMDNDRSVGRNCLTFFYNNCRYKIYNKFVHSLEVKNNKQQIGNNIREWVNNPEERLRETIKNSLDYGCTRLEITFYASDGNLPDIDTIHENIN